MTEKIAHLVFRLPRVGQQLRTVIAEHEEVVRRRKLVWFGVRGAGLSTPRYSLLRNQIEGKIPTYLYVLQGEGAGFIVFRARIRKISAALDQEELVSVPEYYTKTEMIRRASGWICVEHFEEIEEEALESLPLYVKGTSVINALKRGMSSLMMVSSRLS
jgi:hypothetical protein